METSNKNEQLWNTIFAVGHPKLKRKVGWHKVLPAPPRCKLCLAPFRGWGGWAMRVSGKGPSSRNPRYCSLCDKFLRAFPGGAEVELSMVFVDVRGSVTMAEQMTPTQFSHVMNEFYAVATKTLYDTDGFIIDLVGDEVVGVYPPGFSGPDYARKAIRAAEELCRISIPFAPDCAPLSVGVGVHTGVAYIGTMTGAAAGIEDVRTSGDNVNIAARLAAAAQPFEALISESTCKAAGLDVNSLEFRKLELKGKKEPVPVRVMQGRAA